MEWIPDTNEGVEVSGVFKWYTRTEEINVAAMATKRIPNEVLSVLQGMSCDGPVARFNGGQLDRKLYQSVDKVLKSLGGQWTRGKGGHVFGEEASELLADVVSTGEYIDRKQAFQFFETPPEVAEMLASKITWAGVDAVLEPSAGRGALIRAANIASSLPVGLEIASVEVDEKHQEFLASLGTCVTVCDFLKLTPEDIGTFDAVMMNPPFTKSQDILHVTHALSFLRAGGSIAAIMSPGFTFRQDRKAVEFRELIDLHGLTVEPLPEGSFKSSGTSVSTVMVYGTVN